MSPWSNYFLWGGGYILGFNSQSNLPFIFIYVILWKEHICECLGVSLERESLTNFVWSMLECCFYLLSHVCTEQNTCMFLCCSKYPCMVLELFRTIFTCKEMLPVNMMPWKTEISSLLDPLIIHSDNVLNAEDLIHVGACMLWSCYYSCIMCTL